MVCGSAAAVGPVAPEFRVNTTLPNQQVNSSVAELTNDRFVIAWYDSNGIGIVHRRYATNGSAVGDETRLIRGAGQGTGDYGPDVAALAGGGYVIVMSRFQAPGDADFSVFAQRYAADGTTVGDAVQVNTETAGDQFGYAVATLANGGFVVTWQSAGQDGSGIGVYAQRYDANGNPAGGEFRVNTYTSGDQTQPDVAPLASGGFVIVWSDADQGGAYGQRYAANGNPAGSAFLVKTSDFAGNFSVSPRVAPLTDGGFVAALQTSNASTFSQAIFARQYDSAGAAQGPAFQVALVTVEPTPAIAGLANGGFVVTWADFVSNSYEVFGQKYSAAGTQDGAAFPVNVSTEYYQRDPEVAALGSGFVVTWSHYPGVSSSDQDIFGRIFAGAAGPITGTAGPDNLTGTPGDDTIDGKGGADVMTGLAGNDTYIVNVTGDAVVEAANEGTDTVKSSAAYGLPVNVEKLILTGSLAISGSGNSLNNTVTGNSANNTLNGKGGADILNGKASDDQLVGGLGSDTLTGGTGQDRFLFNAALGSTNIDRITDFTPADDTIRLENAVFTGLPATGSLAASAFNLGTAASTAVHHIIYDLATGYLRYDADGTGPTAPVRFATLTTKPAITNADFYVQ